MGHNRAKMVTQTPGTRLVGVCDLIEERARRTGEECGVPYSTDLRRWLEDDQGGGRLGDDRDRWHAEVAIQALEAQARLTTKPMEANVAACDTMISAARRQRGCFWAWIWTAGTSPACAPEGRHRPRQLESSTAATPRLCAR